MIDKVVGVETALSDIESGASIAVGGFGRSGVPVGLIQELCRRNLRNLHVISNNVGTSSDASVGTGRLLLEGRVRKVTCSFPSSEVFHQQFREGKVELELVPQGT